MVSITPLLFFIFSLNDECDSIRSDFQAGVDTLYNKCKSCGSTPSSKTPTAISNSIQSIYTNRYNGIDEHRNWTKRTAHVDWRNGDDRKQYIIKTSREIQYR